MLPDQFQHAFRVLEDESVLQPQHRQTGFAQKSLANIIPQGRTLSVVSGAL